ncbi:DUF1240 domain-containing protein [Vibrio spartinae]|uniref:DUF1240 domain-containing protein n=1 Tax=Vibrio spartinae TaxID=1918945 RepID=A0A1N6MAY1_9VIBR|nr:DUF1240 domain-containing protein [Vibrio spartinae]SIO96609.1 hypothetical protein VSP9026_04412 [Vibrio spartinae]
MKNKIKAKQIIIITLGVIFILLMAWVIWEAFIQTLFGSSNAVIFSFDGIVPISCFILVTWLSVGTYCRSCEFVQNKKYGDIKPKNKTLIRLLIASAILGLSVNYANYFLIIKANNFIECPRKSGYKENLMRDYVNNINLCEKT